MKPNLDYCLPGDITRKLDSLLAKMPEEFLWNGKIALNIPFVLIILRFSLPFALKATAEVPSVGLGLKQHSEQ